MSGRVGSSSYTNGLLVAKTKKNGTPEISLSADSVSLQDESYLIAVSDESSISINAINDIYLESCNPNSGSGYKMTVATTGGNTSLVSKKGSIGINSKLYGGAIEAVSGSVNLNAYDSIWILSDQTGQKASLQAHLPEGKLLLTAGNNIVLVSKDSENPVISGYDEGLVELAAKAIKIDGSSNRFSYAVNSSIRALVNIEGSDLVEMQGNLHASGGTLSINSTQNSSGLTYIDGNIEAYDDVIDEDAATTVIKINQNQNLNSRVMMSGFILSHGGEDSKIDINFGQSGLFKGFSILDNGKINLKFNQNSAWYVERNSAVSYLDIDTAIIDFTAETDKDTSITTDSLDAQNAVFLMDVIATSNKVSNDSLKVQKSASGNAFVHVPSSGQGDGKTDSGVLIETPTGQNISYALASPALSSDGTNTPVIDLGVYNYELKTEDRNGKTVTYLTPYVPKSDPTPDPDPTPTPNPEPNPGEPELSPSANAVLALAGSGMQTTQFLYSLSDLRKRMGEIRYGAEDGLYAGIRGGRDEISSFASTSFRNEYGAWSIGYDHRVNDEWIVGALFEAIEGDQRVKSHGYRADGEDSTQGFRAYATWFNNEGAYADFVIGLNRFDQDISTHMLDGGKVEGDFDGIGWGVSAEVGRQFLMGDDKTWFIEPQAQFAYFRVKGEDFSLDNGMTVDQDSTDSLTGRFGLVFGKTKVDNDGKGYQLTGKFGINHEFMGESDIKVNGVKFSYDSLGTRGYYGVGFNWYLSKHARVYGQVEREQGSRFTSEINARLGVKYHF